MRNQASHSGAGLRVRGRLVVRNGGELVIGDGVILSSRPAVTHLVVGPDAHLLLGHRVEIGHGGAIACHERIVIADDVTLAPFVAVMDFDFHAAGTSAPPAPRPVTIDRGARVGARSIVLPGAHIGARAVVAAGSVVSGAVAPGACVGGNPAVSVGRSPTARSGDAAAIVQRVFGLDTRPASDDGPHSIARWDSLGALELLVELESVLGRTLDEADVARLRTVDDIAMLLGAADTPTRGRSAATVVARVFGLETPPAATARPDDIPRWDSLGMLELVIALESTFGISIDERQLADVRTVGDLERLVR